MASNSDIRSGGSDDTAGVSYETPEQRAADAHLTEKINKINATGLSPDHPLWHELSPPDSYVGGVYWADLPRAERWAWINAQSNAETKKELAAIKEMFKKDPLSPLGTYMRKYAFTGFGLFLEGFTLFSIGNLTSLFQAVWPTCWKTYAVCSENWIAAVTYLQIIGIMIGQVGVGIEGDWVGRKFGLVQDALVMAFGLLMLTAAWAGKNLQGWVIFYAFSQMVYGVGVGGEYPMTSTTAMEQKAGGDHAKNQTDDKLHRGRSVVLSFLMQGWGQMFNQGLLLVLLLAFHGGGNPPYGEVSTQWTYRVSFGIVCFMTLWLAYARNWKATYSSAALRRSKKNARVNQSGYDSASLKLVISHFPGRLLATAGCWFCNDFAFYGNKLFQSTFLKVLQPNVSVVGGWNWNLVNIGVALCGYYLAAFLIDHKLYGRTRMQAVGFFANWLLFFLPAVLYDYLREKNHIHGFQAIYYLSGFFQQFGPNCTTFLVAAEVYPISVRATAHGFSAAMGKLGALLPAILYNYIADHTKFWVVCWFGLIGFFLTIVFNPDTTGLDLREQERYWACVKAGRAEDYHGIAVHRRHLSLWEIYVLKRHLAYDADLDILQKFAELRAEYEEQVQRQNQEKEHPDDHEPLVSESAANFFSTYDRQEKIAPVH